jgi:CelD/BcsL family acetyltransferase involved in cellulose biosynthesis
MESEIDVRQIQDTVSFKNLKQQWEQLLALSPTQSTFLTWEWLFSWWKVYGDNKYLWLITAWRGAELIGIAPLMLETRNTFIRVLTNIGTPQSDISGFIYGAGDKDAVKAIFQYLIHNKKHWDILEFNEFPHTWAEQHEFNHRFTKNSFWILENRNQHFYIQLDNDDWEKYSEKLARKFRYNLRRALKLAEAIGPVKLNQYRGAEVSWEIFKTIVKINRYANYPRIYNSPSERALIKELVEQMASNQNYFEVYILSINNKPVAYEYGFVYQGRFEDWRSGFDTRLPPNVSIGKVLAMKVVQTCIAHKYTEIDFLRGDESYKQEWTPSSRKFTKIRIFNRRKLTAILSYIWLEKIKPNLKKENAASKANLVTLEETPSA